MGYRCADCKAPLQPGWDCGKCGSFAAEEDDPEQEALSCWGLSSFCAEVGHKCREAGKCVYAPPPAGV